MGVILPLSVEVECRKGLGSCPDMVNYTGCSISAPLEGKSSTETYTSRCGKFLLCVFL